MAETFFIQNADGVLYKVDDDGFAYWRERDSSFQKVGERRNEVFAAAAPAESLEDLTVPELRTLAASRGVNVPSDARKADIVEALEVPESEE